MVQKLRERSQGEGGFTLVELLVVMLILGLLAAIAIPSFFNQREKAKDADAKAAARTAQTAIETYATGNQGTYTGADIDGLREIEATLNDSNLSAVTAERRRRRLHRHRHVGRFEQQRCSASLATPTARPTSPVQTQASDGCPAAVAPATTGNWGD